MASKKQIEANRRNAARSTGPRTEQGKARARMNARRHGLASVEPEWNQIWDKISSPSVDQLSARLSQIELQRLRLMRDTDLSNALATPKNLRGNLKHLLAMERYIRRAQAKLKEEPAP